MDGISPVGSILAKLAILAVGVGGIWLIGWPEVPRERDARPGSAILEGLEEKKPGHESTGSEVVPEADEPGKLPFKPGRGDGPVEPNSFDRVAVLDLNEALQSQLERLPGVGPVLAERIIEYRNANGPFRRIEDLERVSGIGRKRVNQLRSSLFIKNRKASRTPHEPRWYGVRDSTVTIGEGITNE
jgi:competence ComEA-like helix-hairpin-helix protein